MFYRWWNRYQTPGWDGSREAKSRPNGPEIDKNLKEKVVKLCTRY